jgi:cyclopropane fatty-acyl-phospholipid synthase-like methyltransferase
MNTSTIHYYKTHSKNLAKRYESAVVTELHNFLKSVFPSGAKLLEIGCGTGRDAAYLLSNGFDVVATDGVQEMLESAVSHHPELLGRLHKIYLPDDLSDMHGPFDGVYSIATLMHLSRPAILDVFSNIRNLVTTEGRFFFSVPLKRDDVQTDEFDRKSSFEIIKTTIAGDGLGRNGITWLNCLTQYREQMNAEKC